MHLADKVVQEAWSEDKSIKGMARELGLSPTGLWYNMRKDRKWTVESWLRVLHHLGVAKVRGNTITIKTEYAAQLLKPSLNQSKPIEQNNSANQCED